MLADTLISARNRILKKFPERQFIHRTGGQVNYFMLTTKAQLWITAIIITTCLWSIFTFASVFWAQSPLHSSSVKYQVKKDEFNKHLINLDMQVADARELLGAQQKEFALAAENFEQKHNTIVAMISQGGISNPNTDLTENIYAQSKILMSPILLDVIPRQPRTIFGKREAMNTGTILDASMVNLESDQNKILVAGENSIQTRIEKNRAILASTGITVVNILKNGRGGVGGPLISLTGKSQNTLVETGAFLPRLDSIKARATEIETLDKAIASVPFAHPIDAESYLTSKYGQRKDPFNKRPTMHSGLDIASYHLAPIVATASGKISFSGRRKGYGRVVEIDHGHGFKTRYAHLEKSYVKRGQKVEKGEKIAGMGSTGRSTSTHLHYEILFEKRRQDPALFLKAGQYVQ